jgi:hypothetical protein
MTTINDRIAADEIARAQLADMYDQLLRTGNPRRGENAIAYMTRIVDELLAHRANHARYYGAAHTDGGRIPADDSCSD